MDWKLGEKLKRILNRQCAEGLGSGGVAGLQGFRAVPSDRSWENTERDRGPRVFPRTNGILGRIIREHNAVPELQIRRFERKAQRDTHLFDIRSIRHPLSINEAIQRVYTHTHIYI